MPQGAGTLNATAVRVISILEYLDGSIRGLNVSEISRKLMIPKSSAHVIILTLERLGYLRKGIGERNYSLGMKAYALGQKMVKTLSLSELALPHMRRLVDRLQLSAHLAVLDRDQGMFIQKIESPGLIKFDTYVGKRMDLHCTGLGKVILAFETPEAVKHILNKPVYMRYTRNTITSPRALHAEIEEIRRLGYAVDDEEEEMGVRCVSVPITDRLGKFVAALSVTGTVGQVPTDRIESIVQLLKRT